MATILLIDDDPMNRNILRTSLERRKHAIVEAKNGEEGLALIGASKPDLIVLDVMMPRMDGWQVCKTLKSNPNTSSIPIVMLTALAQGIDELHGYETGVDDFLTKPCDLKKLDEVVGRLLAKKASLEETK